MITLTNRTVQTDIVILLNNFENVYAHADDGEFKLVHENNDTTTTSYSYDDKEALVADFLQIKKIYTLLTNERTR